MELETIYLVQSHSREVEHFRIPLQSSVKLFHKKVVAWRKFIHSRVLAEKLLQATDGVQQCPMDALGEVKFNINSVSSGRA